MDELGTLKIGIDRSFRGVARDSIGRMLRDETQQPEAIELLLPPSPDADKIKEFDPEEVRLHLDLGSAGKRTVVIGRDAAPRVGFAIEDGISNDDQGFPALDEMAQQARALEPLLLAPLGLEL